MQPMLADVQYRRVCSAFPEAEFVSYKNAESGSGALHGSGIFWLVQLLVPPAVLQQLSI